MDAENKPMASTAQFSPDKIADALGQHHPTKEQADVITARMSSMLVVAGAGAGKTETMSARVVWLIANGYVRPDQVLGLTFTRKAAGELAARVRTRLSQLAQSGLFENLPADDPRHHIADAEAQVTTYDSFVGDVVGEYGLLLPMESRSRIVSGAELWLKTRSILDGWPTLGSTVSVGTMADRVIELLSEMNNHLLTSNEVREESLEAQAYVDNVMGTGKGNAATRKFRSTQALRLQMLDIVDELRTTLRDQALTTFGEQLAGAAQLVRTHPEVGEELRDRFRVVMLDEYQDTGYAQRVFLRELFGGKSYPGLSVTAVGDPMQSIYAWRGATASNLARFRKDFPATDGQPADLKELSFSFRNPGEVLDLANDVAKKQNNESRNAAREATLAQGTEIAEYDDEDMSDGCGETTPAADDSDINDEVPTLPFTELKSFSKKSGRVGIGWFNTDEDEAQWVTEQLITLHYPYLENPDLPEVPPTGSIAVLVRNRALSERIVRHLRSRGVPVELDRESLLEVPEVRDVLDMLRLVVQPEDTVACINVLTSPRWRLGLADIAELKSRASELSARRSAQLRDTDNQSEEAYRPDDLSPLEELEIAAEKVRSNTANEQGEASLADALADPDLNSHRYSPAGTERIAALGRELRRLRLLSTTMPLPDLLCDIMDTLGIRGEIALRGQGRDYAVGAINLDELLNFAADLQRIPGMTPLLFLEYLELAPQKDRDLSAATLRPRPGCVQVTTVHMAKGLEWDTVVVCGAHNKTFTDEDTSRRGAQFSTWVSRAECVPVNLRGDSADEPGTSGVPRFHGEGAEKPAELKIELDEHVKDLWHCEHYESDRLFYVALTRSAKNLLLTGFAYRTRNTTKDTLVPTMMFRRCLDAAHALSGLPRPEPEDEPDADNPMLVQSTTDDRWIIVRQAIAPDSESIGADKVDLSTANGMLSVLRTGNQWPFDPLGSRRKSESEAAELVRQYLPVVETTTGTDTTANHDLPAIPAIDRDTQAALWEHDVSALIAEERQRQADERDPLSLHARDTFSDDVTTSELMGMADDPQAFLRRQLRPVPFKPNMYAKRGTAFHNWVESQWNLVGSLISDDALPGMEEYPSTEPELQRLKENFAASHWAQLTPEAIEQAFALRYRGYFIRGRIDAVFHTSDDPQQGWIVVDWKTGGQPKGAELRRAMIQLAVYKEAWQRILRHRGIDDPQVSAAFFYVRTQHTYQPTDLPSLDDLAADELAAVFAPIPDQTTVDTLES